MKKYFWLAVIFILFVFALGLIVSLVVRAKLTDNRTLKLDKISEVDFCGQTYQSETVLINGVSFVQRLAEIARADQERHICENLVLNWPERDNVIKADLKQSSRYDDVYTVTTTTGPYVVDLTDQEIWRIGPYGDTYIGTLRQESGPDNQSLVKSPTVTEINFCGGTYKSETVLVNGVNFINRLAEIAESEPRYKICEDLIAASSSQQFISLNLDISPGGDDVYLQTPMGLFLVELNRQTIWQIDNYGSTYLGTLK